MKYEVHAKIKMTFDTESPEAAKDKFIDIAAIIDGSWDFHFAQLTVLGPIDEIQNQTD